MLLQWIDQHGLLLLGIAVITVELIGIASALEAIMKSRTPQGAVAWFLSLVALPLVMVPVYWIFGRRRFRGYARARRQDNPALHSIARRVAELLHRHPPSLPVLPHNLLLRERLGMLPACGGNRIRLLIDGEHTFDALFELIDGAEHYLLLLYYILRDDEIGESLLQRLSARARDGIEIKLLYDEIGSIQLSNRYLNRLREAGIAVHPFNSTKGPSNRFQLNFRNHRKLAIADGQRAIVGGSNIGDEYLGRDPDLSPWRDTSLELEGPAVLAAQLTFVEDWFWATDTLPDLRWENHATGDKDVLVLATGPADVMETTTISFMNLIANARERLWIVSPYFVPDSSIVTALQMAALRGVDVRILLPDKADNRLVQLSSYAYFRDVQMAGGRFYRYQNGFLHQKVLLIDNELCSIGTSNMDNRSFRLNFEINLLVRDAGFNREVETMLLRDFDNSVLVPYNDFDNRPLYFRLAVRMAHLLAPVQ